MTTETSAPASARLLVGIGRPDEVGQHSEYLLDVLAGLAAFGVEVQVAMFGDGALRPLLEEVADVRIVEPLPPRSPAGLVQSLARRISPALADRVHDLRTVEVRRELHPPDGIYLHDPAAVPLLRYVRDGAVPVTAYAHPWAYSIAGLSPLDLERLLARADHFVAAEGTARDDLVAAGVDPARIDVVPIAPTFPPVPVTLGERAAARRDVGLPADALVVAVPPLVDWVDCPDLTLSVAWELERIAGAAAPTVLWYGMPAEGDRRWPVDVDVDRMGVTSVRLVADDLAWEQVAAVASVVVLPVRSSATLPDGAIRTAVELGTPVFCWAGHPLAEEVARWGGEVVPRGDVVGMAELLWATVGETAALRRARSVGFRMGTAEVERVVPVAVPLP